MHPEEVPTTMLRPGQVGYIACNMKESSEGLQVLFKERKFTDSDVRSLLAHIGDTFYRVGAPVDPMPGFKPAKAMVGSSLYLSAVPPTPCNPGVCGCLSSGQQ